MSEKINPANFLKTHSGFPTMNDLVKSLARLQTVWSWGAQAWTKMNANCLRFTVNGRHHRGHVYIVVNHSDLFDVYLTSNRGTVKEVLTDIYVDSLVDSIDAKIEYVPEYRS